VTGIRCNVPLEAGAKFCSSCGLAVGPCAKRGARWGIAKGDGTWRVTLKRREVLEVPDAIGFECPLHRRGDGSCERVANTSPWLLSTALAYFHLQRIARPATCPNIATPLEDLVEHWR
jgi:hypothetical protein